MRSSTSCKSLSLISRKAFFVRYGRASGWMTLVKCVWSCRNAVARAVAVASASSGMRPSITATISLSFCGNRCASAVARCFQGRLAANMVPVSVVTPRSWLVMNRLQAATSSATSTTRTRLRTQRATSLGKTVVVAVAIFIRTRVS